MKLLSKLLLTTGLIAGLISCKKDDDPVPVDPNVTFKAVLNGAQEVAPALNTSTNTGTATLVFNTTTKTFTITVTHTVANTNVGHIHKGAAGSTGGVIFPFASPPVSPVTYTSGVLDATQEADLNANLYYVNIHSPGTYVAGEIRGQLLKQ
jgi:hypothetical protein